MNILGIDASLAAPGYCWGPDRGQADTLRTKPQHGDRRLCQIRDATLHYISGLTPGLAVIERNPPHGHSGNVLDYVHGVILEVLARRGWSHVYVAATSLKLYATGSGGKTADKAAMAAAMQDRAGWVAVDDNAVDAWWLRDMAASLATQPLDSRPEHERRALLAGNLAENIAAHQNRIDA